MVIYVAQNTQIKKKGSNIKADLYKNSIEINEKDILNTTMNFSAGEI